MSFKIGDRVKAIHGEHEGLLGRVVVLRVDYPGIEYDENILGHTCGGTGKEGHCWYEHEKDLEHVGKEEDFRLL